MTGQDAPTHVFDEAVALEPVGENLFRGRTHAAWANMVGPFGGITAATMLGAVLQHPEKHGDPLALTLNYAGPVAEGAVGEAHQHPAVHNAAQVQVPLLGDEAVAPALAVAPRQERPDQRRVVAGGHGLPAGGGVGHGAVGPALGRGGL